MSNTLYMTVYNHLPSKYLLPQRMEPSVRLSQRFVVRSHLAHFHPLRIRTRNNIHILLQYKTAIHIILYVPWGYLYFIVELLKSVSMPEGRVSDKSKRIASLWSH